MDNQYCVDFVCDHLIVKTKRTIECLGLFKHLIHKIPHKIL